MKLRNGTFAITNVLVGVPADQRICRVVVHDNVRPILPPVCTWAQKNGIIVDSMSKCLVSASENTKYMAPTTREQDLISWYILSVF